jgi:hypothetical protein
MGPKIEYIRKRRKASARFDNLPAAHVPSNFCPLSSWLEAR